MNFRRIYTLFLLSALITSIQVTAQTQRDTAETHYITGSVYVRIITNLPIYKKNKSKMDTTIRVQPFADITLKEANIRTQSDTIGKFKIAIPLALSGKKLTIIFSAPGCTSEIITIDTIDNKLEPKPLNVVLDNIELF